MEMLEYFEEDNLKNIYSLVKGMIKEYKANEKSDAEVYIKKKIYFDNDKSKYFEVKLFNHPAKDDYSNLDLEFEIKFSNGDKSRTLIGDSVYGGCSVEDVNGFLKDLKSEMRGA